MISNQITEILTPRGCSRITGTPPITLNLWSHAHAWVFSPQYDEETKTTRACNRARQKAGGMTIAISDSDWAPPDGSRFVLRAWLAMKEMSD
jgi:hypothetical protein